MNPTPIACIGAGVLLSYAPFSAGDDLDARAQFMQAYAQATAPAGVQGSSDSPALQAYLLYPYLQAARIRSSLQQAPPAPDPIDAVAGSFLAEFAGEPVVRDLRRDWLTSLAKRQQWAAVAQQYREDTADAAQRCNYFTARIQLRLFDQLADAIAQQWAAAKDSLPECEPGFAWLRSQNVLSADLLEKRIRLALDSGNTALSRQLVSELPAERAVPLQMWIGLIDEPGAYVGRLIADPHLTVEPKALLDGWTRLARKDPDEALSRYDDLVHARQLSEEQASPLALSLALALAWNRRAEAGAFFDRVLLADMDVRALEWRARAALWGGDWEAVTRAIGDMPDSLRRQSRWRYWQARAAERRHDTKAARQLYQNLIPDDNYYAVLAAARLHRPFDPHPMPLEADAQQISRLAQLPALIRSRELLRCQLQSAAEAEWWHAQGALDAAAKHQSVRLALDWGWYDAAILTAARQGFFEDYASLYPRPFDAPIKVAAKASRVAPELIYAVLRQESLYRVDAVSTADALGLLQLQLGTAKKIAASLRQPLPVREDLFNPKVNIPLGAAELALMLNKFGGQVPVALAAYNAGPNAVSRWLPPTPRDSDVWVENIPYNETRTYVQRVLWHRLIFAWLAAGKPQQTRAWLYKVN
jgi:soluble lytic murein transglycosylase